mgnify:CR=1 FL=1
MGSLTFAEEGWKDGRTEGRKEVWMKRYSSNCWETLPDDVDALSDNGETLPDSREDCLTTEVLCLTKVFKC